MLTNVLEYLESTSHRVPERTAVIDCYGSLTFRELAEQSRALAARIAFRAVGRNNPVAIYLPKSRHCVIAVAAILHSGNCYAPLDHKSPCARLTALLRRLEPALVITDSGHAAEVEQTGIPADRILVIDAQEPAAPVDATTWRTSVDTDPVYIIHTSGSTGTPKGVVIPHRGVIDYVEWARDCYGINENDTIGNQAPFHFDNSTLDLYLCFSTGAALVLIPEEYFLFPARLINYLYEQSVTVIFWVPSVLASVANLDILGAAARPPLRSILFAGEVMQTKHLNYWRRHYPDALFSNLYGPTEVTVDCTYYIVDRDFGDGEALPIGFPRRNAAILILNETNQAAAPGERGELCVRGTCLANGYWNDPENTASAFVQNPLNPHYPERIYRTGDIVYRNERGEIFFVGRNDSQVKHLGYRIELGEIDTAIMGTPGVRNACTVYDPAKQQLVTFYEAQAELDPVLLRKAVLARLPKYMTPSRYIQLSELPLNANRKVDRKQLARRLS